MMQRCLHFCFDWETTNDWFKVLTGETFFVEAATIVGIIGSLYKQMMC